MNKKNIFIYFLLALPMVLMTSCLKDQEDYFDESASARSTKYLENARRVLMSSENGWLLNYFPDREQSYGGFAYILKFDEDNVEARYVFGYIENGESDVEKNKPITSTYVLNNEDGPVLMFDTYNEYTHLFATPSGGAYEAYDGDFMFIIMGISEDENVITLKGSRSGNIMYMYRNTVNPDEYLNKARAMSDEIFLSTYQKDNVKLVLDLDNQQINIAVGEESVDASYIVTDKGLKLYEPVKVGDYEFDEFTYNTTDFTLTSSADASLVMKGSLPEGWKSYEELAGTYTCGDETITVTCDGDGQNFTIAGMTAVGSVKAKYKSSTGSFVIETPQYMGKYGSYFSWFIASGNGYVSWAGNTLNGSNSTDGNTITFKGMEYNSVIEYAFSSEEPSGSTAAGWLTQYPDPLTFVRAE